MTTYRLHQNWMDLWGEEITQEEFENLVSDHLPKAAKIIIETSKITNGQMSLPDGRLVNVRQS